MIEMNFNKINMVPEHIRDLLMYKGIWNCPVCGKKDHIWSHEKTEERKCGFCWEESEFRNVPPSSLLDDFGEYALGVF